MEFRVGLGQDTHRLVAGRPLILGGVPFDHHLGLLGHSDADVVLHAVADAMLGAAGDGDIGELFPDTDPRYAGLDSRELLRIVCGRTTAAGWRIVNCDVVIHAQKPKLGPAKHLIRSSLAQLLEIPESALNVKAKTGELVGPIGRQEAISCDVVILLKRDVN
jgi:2-C-methyl-D-erythritol 2,4-cyclodiphosphate synthase